MWKFTQGFWDTQEFRVICSSSLQSHAAALWSFPDVGLLAQIMTSGFSDIKDSSLLFSFLFSCLLFSCLFFSQVSEATAKQKPKTEFCFGEFYLGVVKRWLVHVRRYTTALIFVTHDKIPQRRSLWILWAPLCCVFHFMLLAVINAVSRRYYLQANDAVDMRDWVDALNKASKITVRATRIHSGTHHTSPHYMSVYITDI